MKKLVCLLIVLAFLTSCAGPPAPEKEAAPADKIPDVACGKALFSQDSTETLIAAEEPGAADVKVLGTENTGVIVLTWSGMIAAGLEEEDIVFAFADSDSSGDSWQAYAILVRFRGGKVDARNGDKYEAIADFPYVPGKAYRFRVVTDTAQKLYSVWVNEVGGEPVQVAKEFAYRVESANADDIGKFIAGSGHGSRGAAMSLVVCQPEEEKK